MLKISDYSNQINTLHNEGKSALEIATILNFKYSQPVYNYFKKMGWKRLSRDEYPTNNLYSVNSSFFEKIDTEEKAYIIGFIAADGHVDAKHYRLNITLKDSDYKLL